MADATEEFRTDGWRVAYEEGLGTERLPEEVEDRTGGEVRLGPGTLYGAIKRMIADGLIEEYGERPDPELDDQPAATTG